MMNTDLLFSVRDLTYLGNGPYTFEVRENEVVGLTGASGIGKTQMLRALVDIIVHDGEVRLGGVPATAFSAPEWRKKVGYVPADSAWWRDTVGEHFPGGGQSRLYPNWFESIGFTKDVLKWRISRLSTGERQRLALVRALVHEPSVLLLDEPCSALDAGSTLKVEKILHEYQKRENTALIWVSHDLDQLKRVTTRCYRVEKNCLDTVFSASY